MSPKTEAMRHVKLKHHLRPMMSHSRPQEKAPTQSPAEKAALRSPTWFSATPSSAWRGPITRPKA